VVIGSDLIYNGTPFDSLSKLINLILNPNGKAFIIIPTDRYCKDLFLDHMKDFKLDIINLNNQEY
jgi:hypothetical protein